MSSDNASSVAVSTLCPEFEATFSPCQQKHVNTRSAAANPNVKPSTEVLVSSANGLIRCYKISDRSITAGVLDAAALSMELGLPFSDDPEYDISETDLFDAATTQLSLGWYALLCGFIAKPLVRIQQQQYSSIESKNEEKDGQCVSSINAGTLFFNYGSTARKPSMTQTKYKADLNFLLW